MSGWPFQWETPPPTSHQWPLSHATEPKVVKAHPKHNMYGRERLVALCYPGCGCRAFWQDAVNWKSAFFRGFSGSRRIKSQAGNVLHPSPLSVVSFSGSPVLTSVGGLVMITRLLIAGAMSNEPFQLVKRQSPARS